MAALLAGQSVSAVAREYKLPKGTVSGWKRKATQEVAGVASDATQKAEVGDLLLEYLRASMEALTAQARLFGDPAWLRTQDASQLAVLHGVQTDKAIRLLEAMSTADAEPDAG